MTAPEWSSMTLGMAVEIGGMCLSGFIFFRTRRYTFAEAAAYGIITGLMLISLLLHIVDLFGIPEWMVLGEGILVCGAVSVLTVQRSRWRESLKILKFFVFTYPLGSFVLVLGWLLLFMGLLLVPAGENPAGSLSFTFPVPDLSMDIQSLPDGVSNPRAGSSLSFFYQRWHPNTVSRILGLLMYLSIAFSTYSLSRRYSWPSTAFTVTLVVIGMPQLVYQSFSPAETLVPAAAGLFGLLAVHRLIELPNRRDIALLLPGIAFGVTDDPVGWIFPIILLLLAIVLLIRRHGARFWRGFILARPLGLGLAIVSALIFSGGLRYGRPDFTEPGTRPVYQENQDGLIGAAGNLTRYFFESADPIPPLDYLWKWTMGVRLSEQFQSGYDRFLKPWVGTRGAAEPFVLTRYQNRDVAWFGPFAFLLILPAVGYALFRGHRRIKAVAVALTGYLYVITLMLAWKAGNGKFLIPFFTCGGFLVASLLPPWRVSSSTKRLLRVGGLLLFFYSISNHPNLKALITNL
ncbi:MAG: hypothetical protein ACOC0H_04380 [Thermodesulfobacteriota bacterium]